LRRIKIKAIVNAPNKPTVVGEMEGVGAGAGAAATVIAGAAQYAGL
jgi:hypothetical protein